MRDSRIEVVSADSVPHQLAQFRQWVETEWGTVSAFENTFDNLVIPVPLLAVSQRRLLGGLGFTGFSKPGTQVMGVWVNTLYVVPDYRRQGIASALITAAALAAQRLGIDELYVLTDVPRLYAQLDWHVVSSDNQSTILKRALAG